MLARSSDEASALTLPRDGARLSEPRPGQGPAFRASGGLGPRGPKKTFENPKAPPGLRDHDHGPTSPRQLSNSAAAARAVHEQVPPDPIGRKNGGGAAASDGSGSRSVQQS
eukprot:2528855-Pyramimonas_sp.AAC.1